MSSNSRPFKIGSIYRYSFDPNGIDTFYRLEGLYTNIHGVEMAKVKEVELKKEGVGEVGRLEIISRKFLSICFELERISGDIFTEWV